MQKLREKVQKEKLAVEKEKGRRQEEERLRAEIEKRAKEEMRVGWRNEEEMEHEQRRKVRVKQEK